MTMRQLVLDMGLAPVPSLDNFVAGRNAGLLEHLRVWSRNPMRSPVPTFIWGGAGSGKTHLLQATCAALRERGVPTICRFSDMTQFFQIKNEIGGKPKLAPEIQVNYLVPLMVASATANADRFHLSRSDA